MLIEKRINYKKYIFFALLTTSVSSLFCHNYKEVIVVFICAIATYFNQVMLVRSVGILTDSNIENSSKKVLPLMIGKVFILFGFLALGVHFMGNRIIICIANYVLLIGVLGISLRKGLNDE